MVALAVEMEEAHLLLLVSLLFSVVLDLDWMSEMHVHREMVVVSEFAVAEKTMMMMTMIMMMVVVVVVVVQQLSMQHQVLVVMMMK